MPRIHANNFVTTLNGDISSGTTSIVITSTTGFPTVGSGTTANITLANGSTIEIVTCTARSGSTLTVTRAAEGTVAAAFVSGSTVSIRPTADSVDRKADRDSYTTTATAAGTTTLTVNSTRDQFFTGSTTQTVILPVTSTLALGRPFHIVNESSGNVTVQSSGANSIQVMAANTILDLECILISGTTAASWYANYRTKVGSSGSVTGPGSSTDNAVSRFDGTGGSTIQNSGVIIDDSNNISGGTWQGSVVGLAYGGSNKNITADNGAIVYSDADSFELLASTATASKILLSGASAAPTWSTSTIPTSAGATSGKHLKSNGTNYVLTTTTYADSGSTGKVLIGDGTNYVESTSTIPTSAGATALKHLKSDGTNYVLTTATISDTPSTAGKVLVSDGTNWITSTPTFPNASATSRKIIVSDGTNWIASTETQATPGSSGNINVSDGTNWVNLAGTGSGNFARATSPTLVTPILGTPQSGNLSTCTAYPQSSLTGLGTNVSTALAINMGTSGAISTYTKTAFNVYCATSQSIATSTVTTVILDTIVFDTGSYFDNVTNYRYTPLIAGKYFVTATLMFQPSTLTTNSLCIIAVRKNGVDIADIFEYVTLTGDYTTLQTSLIVSLNGSTDYLTLVVYQAGVASATLYGGAGSCFMSGVLME